MRNVGIVGQNVSSYFQDIIAQRRERQEERMDEAAQAGLSGKDADTLAKLADKNDQLIDKAFADGKITRSEFQKIMRALDNQNSLVERLLAGKGKLGRKEAKPLGDMALVGDQDKAMTLLQSGMARVQKMLDQAIKSGKLTPEQQKKLESSLAKSQDALNKAMEDGKLTKGEVNSVNGQIRTLDRQMGTYTRNRQVVPMSMQELRALLHASV